MLSETQREDRFLRQRGQYIGDLRIARSALMKRMATLWRKLWTPPTAIASQERIRPFDPARAPDRG
jgi:hypothetical protein